MTDRTSYDAEDAVRVLQQELGPRFEESYEHGKQVMRDVLVKRLGLPRGDASRVVDELEEAQTDEPGPPRGDGDAPNPGGRYWAIGDEADVDLPGAR